MMQVRMDRTRFCVFVCVCVCVCVMGGGGGVGSGGWAHRASLSMYSILTSGYPI